MKTINKKILSVLLVLCMIFQTGMYTIASAVTSDTLTIEDDQSDNETVNSEENVVANSNGVTLEDVLAGLASPYDYFGELDPDTVPEAVGMEKALERVHLRRLYTEETGLNDVVFLNADGTKTVYMFDYPVKTVNEHGLVTDISLEIADTTNSATPYETANGNAVTAFSNRYTDGINLSGNNVSVTLLPILPTVSTTTGLDATANAQIGNDTTASNNYFESTATRIDKKTISYKYDDSTSVEYSLTYTGFKEDIVVKEYTGQTEYDFTLVTNGLKLEERKNSFYLVDENNNIKATLGNIIIFTADNANNAYGDMTYKTVVENEKYVLTIHVSDEYLRDERTKYPIRIDPTIEINYDSDGAGAIADITINTADPLSGTDGEISLGKWGSDQSVSRILMKFPGLNLSDIPTAASITSATVEIHDLMCQHERLGVYCYVFTGNVWSESNATWNNVSPNSHGEQLSFHYVSYADGLEQATSQRYSFNITNAVKGWKAGNYDPEKGIIFQAGAVDEANTTHNYKTFASYNRSNHKPSFSVTYSDGSSNPLLQDNTYYINNSYTGKYIWNTTYTTTKSGLISSLGDSIRWEVRNVDGGCIIRSTEDTTKYLGVDDSGDFAILTYYQVSNGIIPSDCIWNVAVAFGGGLNISHTSSFGTQYLYSPVQYLDLSFSYGTVNSDLRAQSTWRVVSVDNYSNTSSTQYREMSSFSSFRDVEMVVGGNDEIVIDNMYDCELWANISDFIFSSSPNNIFNIQSHYITSDIMGGAKIYATHKVTNLVFSFSAYSGFSFSISSPSVPDSIIEGLQQPYNVWPAGDESLYCEANGFNSLTRVEMLNNIYNLALATIAGGAIANYEQASAMLSHYLYGDGALYTIDMDKMLSEWTQAKAWQTQDMNTLIEIVEATATYGERTIKTYTGISHSFDSAESSDWYMAIGSYYTYISCTYRIVGNRYYAEVTYSLHDAYDWEKESDYDLIPPVSSRDMWELHHGGLARNYEVQGSVSYTMTWLSGQSFGEGVVVS